MPASRQAGARSPFVLSPSSHKRPVLSDRAFVVFANEAGQAAGTFEKVKDKLQNIQKNI